MKQFLKVLAMIFLVLFGSFCALVLVCAVRPEVTQKLADFLYPGRRQAVSADADDAGEAFNGGNLMKDSFSLGEASGEGEGTNADGGSGAGDGSGLAELSGTGLPGAETFEGTPASALPRAEGIDQGVNPGNIQSADAAAGIRQKRLSADSGRGRSD